METIREGNIVKQSNSDTASYMAYVCRRRVLANFADGLKPVQRRIIYALYHDFPQTRTGKTVKTASLTGRVIERYHPHGDTSVAGAIKPMVNWFESNEPLIKQQGSFGNIWGDSPSEPRYTEVALTPYAVDCIVGDMNYSDASTDWELNYDGQYKEPIYFPAVVPNLLINGSFGIGVGFKTEIPKHNLGEVIDATIKLIDNPNAEIVLIPDDPQGSDIINADWKSISETGRGKFKTRAIIDVGEYKNRPALFVNTLPSMVFFEAIRDKIEKLKEANVLPQIVDILNNTRIPDYNKKNPIEKFQVIISLKKGADPEYVKNVLYSTTLLEKATSVNFECIFNDAPVSWGYKKYLLEFIKFRKERKARLYNNKLKECKTRMHELKLYIDVLKSGKIDIIVDKLRKNKSSDDNELIEFIIKTLKSKMEITPLQARFLLNTNIKKLSLGYLKQYEDEYSQLEKDAIVYQDLCIHTEKLGDIVKQELLAVKKKYGTPRKSRIISAYDADNIPDGTFKITLSAKGLIKKADPGDRSSIKDDKAIASLIVDNKDNLLLFGKLGKVYKLPVYKIPFTPNTNGTDLRIVVKKYAGEGISVIMTEFQLKQAEAMFKEEHVECNVFILTKLGLFKRMELSELDNVSLSGLMYTKLNDDDEVIDVICMDPENEMLLYSKNKVLRVKGTEAPLLNRMTKGNIAMTSKFPMNGMMCIIPEFNSIVAITKSGRVNKIPLNIIPITSRAKAGSSVIRLNKTDDIESIMVCKEDDSIVAITNRNKVELKISNLKASSSINSGDKVLDSSGIIFCSHIMK